MDREQANTLYAAQKEVRIALHAFENMEFAHDYLVGYGEVFYGTDHCKSDLARAGKFVTDYMQTTCLIFDALVETHIALQDTEELFATLRKAFPAHGRIIERATFPVRNAVFDLEALMHDIKAEVDDFLLLHDLPGSYTTVAHDWDKLCDYVPPAYEMDKTDKAGGVAMLRHEASRITTWHHHLSDYLSGLAQYKVGYFYQCIMNDAVPLMPFDVDGWDRLDRRQQHGVMSATIKNDLEMGKNFLFESDKLLRAVMSVTETCFPKNRHQLGVKFN